MHRLGHGVTEMLQLQTVRLFQALYPKIAILCGRFVRRAIMLLPARMA